MYSPPLGATTTLGSAVSFLGGSHEELIHGSADNWGVEGGGSRHESHRGMPQIWHQRRAVLQLEGQVRRHDGLGSTAAEGTGGRQRHASKSRENVLLHDSMYRRDVLSDLQAICSFNHSEPNAVTVSSFADSAI
jgi:hypothetical protein